MRKLKITKVGLSNRSKNFTKTEKKSIVSFYEELTSDIKGISDKLMRKIVMSLDMLKMNLSMYLLFEDSLELDNMFRSLSRNPIFDITGVKYFSTGLSSAKALKCTKCETSKDHILQRTKALKIIYKALVKNPKMTTEEYILLLKKYCSTVRLTKDEHQMVNVVSRQHPEWSNRKIYNKLKIKIPGLGKYEQEMNLVRTFQHNY